ncbi:MAG: sterol desaturase family protein [Gammaproteobacteria bacterium]|nr:sterol desaturase family protein [Gammaproteobacteria bacterium]
MLFDELIIKNELTIRLAFFFAVFSSVALWESVAPKRVLILPKAFRWVNNLGMTALNSLMLRILFPAAAAGFAVFIDTQGWGVLHNIEINSLSAVVFSVIVLDFAIYLQHVLFHAVPLLWRFHRVHHADLDYDVTTGARFHPLEMVLSMLIKFMVISVLGPPVAAVILFEVLLNVTAMFNHGNIHVPERIDRVLRWFLVTPDMHRVHHSVEEDESNSNFGFSIPWWDRCLGTYRDQPRAGHQKMFIGLLQYRKPEQVNKLLGMLMFPFIKSTEHILKNNSSERQDKT